MTIWILFLQVRRTRISERMRKLQDLVPNMDKVKILHFSQPSVFVSIAFNSQIHDSNEALYFCVKSILLLLLEKLMILVSVSCWQQTNTADMLDLAVDYIKDLQKQYKVLRNNQPENEIQSHIHDYFYTDTELDHKTGHRKHMNTQNSL